MFREMAITFCLLYKLGLPPFHGWVFRLIPELNLFSFGVLIRINKITPIIILSQINTNSMLFLPSLLRLLIVVILTFYRINSIYYILTISSIINFQWFLFCLKNRIWLRLVVVYCLILIRVIILLKLNLVFKTKDFAKINTIKFSLLGFSFFSLAGLPPFLGFLIKLTIIKIIVLLKVSFIWLLLLLTLIIQFAYINIFYFSYCAIPNKRVSNETKLYDQRVLARVIIFRFPNWVDLVIIQI